MRPIGFLQNKGVIIILTTWILIIILVLALCISFRARVGLRLVQYYKDSVCANSVIDTAIKKFIEAREKGELIYNNEKVFKDIKVDNASFSIAASDEQSKINLNSIFADIDFLKKFPSMDYESAVSIVEYRKSKTNFKIENLEELTLAAGIKPQVLSQLDNYATVFGKGLVNINTAKKEVLRGLGLNETLADKIIRYRSGLDRIEFTQDDKFFDNNDLNFLLEPRFSLNDEEKTIFMKVRKFLTATSDCFRLNILISTGKINKKVSAVIEKMSQDNYKVKYWYES